MKSTLTVSLPKTLHRKIGQSARTLQLTKREFVRRALRDRLWAESFEASRRRLVPLARAQGIHGDEDVFKRVS